MRRRASPSRTCWFRATRRAIWRSALALLNSAVPTTHDNTDPGDVDVADTAAVNAASNIFSLRQQAAYNAMRLSLEARGQADEEGERMGGQGDESEDFHDESQFDEYAISG